MNPLVPKLVLVPAPAAPLSSVKKRLVLLDDDLVMLGALERLLSRAGFIVTATHDPKRAIEAVMCDGADAIISDLHMPDMGGNIVLAMIAKAAPKTARLLLTSDTDFNTVAVLSVPCSVDAFIPKREVSARLVPTLRDLLEGGPREDASTVPDQVREFARSVVRALARRSQEALVHSERVAAWAVLLASSMRLPSAQVLDIELGALLHDVGDIGVKDSICLKAGPLSPEEAAEMRRHPEIGAALLADLSALRRAIPVVESHHERFDGTGYPNGLAGNATPLEARIFQIADAYDAIRRDRPYRKGRSDEQTRLEMSRHVGTQFDPMIHEAFMRIDPEEWSSVATRIALC